MLLGAVCKGFDVYNALEACSEHLEQFGGHMYAAGMTLKEENYQIFKDALKRSRKNHSSDMLTPEIAVDAEIDFADISKINPNLKQFEPYGPKYD
jgi:single-stranded-DNA-specific exonuclease